jgi:hypothetical protein
MQRPPVGAKRFYSWLPRTGLNLIPRKATPMGVTFDASMVTAVQTTLIDVAAMAVVPWATRPVVKRAVSK